MTADDNDRKEAPAEGRDETRVSAEIPPEAVGDEAAAGEGGEPGDTAESPAVPQEEAGAPQAEGDGGTEIYFSRDRAGEGGEQPASAPEPGAEAAAIPPVPSAPPPPPPPPPAGGTSPAEAAQEAESAGGRPEVLAVGAFVGGFAFAKLLKRIGGGDDE
jgi:hypothetical protein